MKVFDHIRQLLSDVQAPVFLEIGAHLLEDTRRIIPLLRPPYTYYAFEPDPRNVERIQHQQLAAGFGGQGSKFALVDAAISDRPGRVTLHLSSGSPTGGEDWTGSSSIRAPKNHLTAHPWCKFGDTVEVRAVTLDQMMSEKKLNHVDFIWADVQGAEADMVKGGRTALAHTRYLYCEFSDQELYQGQAALEEWMKLLPGRWEVIEKFEKDVLLRNEDYRPASHV